MPRREHPSFRGSRRWIWRAPFPVHTKSGDTNQGTPYFNRGIPYLIRAAQPTWRPPAAPAAPSLPGVPRIPLFYSQALFAISADHRQSASIKLPPPVPHRILISRTRPLAPGPRPATFAGPNMIDLLCVLGVLGALAVSASEVTVRPTKLCRVPEFAGPPLQNQPRPLPLALLGSGTEEGNPLSASRSGRDARRRP